MNDETAALLSELATLAYAWRPSQFSTYVDRAATLITAQDAEIEQVQKAYSEVLDGYEAHKADLAAAHEVQSGLAKDVQALSLDLAAVKELVREAFDMIDQHYPKPGLDGMACACSTCSAAVTWLTRARALEGK